jgi:hypothetical protein
MDMEDVPTISGPDQPALVPIYTLYADVLQAILEWLPNDELFETRTLSRLWHCVVHKEHNARIIWQKKRKDLVNDGLENIDAVVVALLQDSPDTLDALVQIRCIVSVTGSPHNERIIHQPNLVPRLVQLMQHTDPQMQLEAFWCITNLASTTTEHVQILLSHQVAPTLVRGLQSTHEAVCKQSLWALENIAVDSTMGRDAVLAAGVFEEIQRLCILDAQTTMTVSNLVVLRWMSSLLRSIMQVKPYVEFSVLEPMIPVLRALLGIHDNEVTENVANALVSICTPEHPPNCMRRTKALLGSGIIPLLVARLDVQHLPVQTAILQACIYITTCGDYETQALIDVGIIPVLMRLLHHPEAIVRRRSASVLSNVAAGTHPQIQTMVEHPAFATQVAAMLAHEPSSGVKCELIWIIQNATFHLPSNDRFRKVGVLQTLRDIRNNKNTSQTLATRASTCIKLLEDARES